jgi:hypothetical protein
MRYSSLTTRLGVDDKTIQGILRHSSLATTEAIYIKLVQSDACSFESVGIRTTILGQVRIFHLDGHPQEAIEAPLQDKRPTT